ncbi:MAG: hypothetical protein KatS3mg110_3298 [Pirellulaceae bacterium]|nr:MAG: hypothetical protein KatS3mg110_3298 [Pirellulaceae bacterium]
MDSAVYELYCDVTPLRPQQLAALRASHNQYQELVGLIGEPHAGSYTGPALSRCTLIVAGPASSGKSTVLRACSLFAVAARGQDGLLVCRDASACQQAYESLNRVCRQLGMQGLVVVGPWNGPSSAAWPTARESVPHLWVADPEELPAFLNDERLRPYLEWVAWDDMDRVVKERHGLLAALETHAARLFQMPVPFQLLLASSQPAAELREFALRRLGWPAQQVQQRLFVLPAD